MVTQPNQQDMMGLAQEMQKRQQMQAMLRQMPQAQHQGAMSSGQATSGMLAQALQGYVQGMAAKKAGNPQQNIWAPGFDGSAGGWTGQH